MIVDQPQIRVSASKGCSKDVDCILGRICVQGASTAACGPGGLWSGRRRRALPLRSSSSSLRTSLYVRAPMGSGLFRMLLVNPQVTDWCRKVGHPALPEGWVGIAAVDDGATTSDKISKRFETAVVDYNWNSVVDWIAIGAHVSGELVRVLDYCGDDKGWREQWGAPLEFEAATRLKPLLRRKRLSARTDGEKILEAFIGANPGSRPWDWIDRQLRISKRVTDQGWA